jgi:archaellum biogenesis protein FlaJ (TadC family)
MKKKRAINLLFIATVSFSSFVLELIFQQDIWIALAIVVLGLLYEVIYLYVLTNKSIDEVLEEIVRSNYWGRSEYAKLMVVISTLTVISLIGIFVVAWFSNWGWNEALTAFIAVGILYFVFAGWIVMKEISEIWRGVE